jgi:exoribonuclease-2
MNNFPEPENKKHRLILQNIAHSVFSDKGLYAYFSKKAQAELDAMSGAPTSTDSFTRDLRTLPWCSIDNDDSLDLDQLTVAEALPDGATKILVAVADVDALVKQRSAIDDHARHNTATIYTVAEIFPMIPERLSTDLTSLNLATDRLAVVIEIVVANDGLIGHSDVSTALVRNHAKLAYNSVAAWLDGAGPMPEGISSIPGLEENIILQDRIAQQLRKIRHTLGALDFETIEARPVFDHDQLKNLAPELRNRAKDIIEDFMIAANGVTARYLTAKNFPALRRIVRTPKYWNRIIEIAKERGSDLPQNPDPIALEKFLLKEKSADPVRFPDLSLSIIKLLGPGEYVVEIPGTDTGGHFGLAVKDYTHSTAPNRRFPDLITQRLLKAALRGEPQPYSNTELDELAKYCTAVENDIKKIVRQVEKSAAALLLESKIGQRFEAMVTGAADKGTWVRLMTMPIEGRVVRGTAGLKVGQQVWVKLVRTDAVYGHIDFVVG